MVKIVNLRLGENFVPILGIETIEKVTIDIIKLYKPELLIEANALDIDDFTEFFLGYSVDPQYLSHNGCYLGRAVFEDKDIFIYDKESNSVKLLNFKGNTIILDTSLYESSSYENLRRFTLGHECAHLLLHKKYFEQNEQTMLNRGKYLRACKKESFNEKRKLVTDNDWLEWQANTFSSCLLMNRQAVLNFIEKLGYSLDSLTTEHITILSGYVAEKFKVSNIAAKVRLNMILNNLIIKERAS